MFLLHAEADADSNVSPDHSSSHTITHNGPDQNPNCATHTAAYQCPYCGT